MELDDAVVDISVRYAIVHLILWQGLHKFNFKASTDNLSRERLIDGREILKILTSVEKVVFPTLTEYADKFMLNQILHDSVFDYQNFVMMELGDYVQSLDLVGLYKIMGDPNVKKIIDNPLTSFGGPSEVEKVVKMRSDAFIDLLGTKGAIEENQLLLYQQLGVLNTGQIAQMMVNIGNRTDINDDIIPYVVQSNYMNGVSTPCDIMIDSLSGKKPIFYLKNAIQKSQYTNRKLNLMGSEISRIYKEDCKTDSFLTVLLTKKMAKCSVGKLVVSPDGSLVEINKTNMSDYFDKVVTMRSPLGCRHSDGVCVTCGGTLLARQDENLKIGLISAGEVSTKASQGLMSAKHLNVITSLIYQLPYEANSVFNSDRGKISFNSDFIKYIRTGYIGIYKKEFGIITDILELEKDKKFDYNNFSDITKVIIKIATIKPNVEDYQEIEYDLLGENEICPYLHKELLLYMKGRYNSLEFTTTPRGDEIVWIPFNKLSSGKNWSYTGRLFGSIATNDSMVGFVKRFESFFSSSIIGYTSARLALEDLTSLVYSKVDLNLLHLEIILRSFMVTSDVDFSIPKNPDLDKVMFKPLSRILTNRSIDIEFGYEDIYGYLTKFYPYIYPTTPGIFKYNFDI